MLFNFNEESWEKFFSITNVGTPFYVDSTFSYLTQKTLRSGKISNSETSKTTLTFVLERDGFIEFPYTVSSEKNCDKFTVFIDGVEKFTVSGGINWTIFKQDLSNGQHSLTLQYKKNGSVDSGLDACAIGELTIDGIAREPMLDTSFEVNPLQDNEFLKNLDSQNLQSYYAKIVVLNMKEYPIEEISGRITEGNISINGDSSVRRTCNLTFLAEKSQNDLTNINNLLSINKKIKIYIGIENNISYKYDNIIWFPQGVFIICQPSISYSLNGLVISLSCKDKMCLLNGECGGGLPAPITFSSYDEIQKDGSIVKKPQRMYDIIQTLVCNYGGESLDKIFINDLPLEIKQIVRYIGKNTLYYNPQSSFYTTDEDYVKLDDEASWKTFGYNENVGYIYTDFTYPGELQSNIGDNVCSVLDKIKTALGNYEYFYDIEGNFVFQEIKNYLNNSYNPLDIYRLDNNKKVEVASNNLAILDNLSYQVDFHGSSKTVYDFTENTGLINSYSNVPIYTNIKNDFHIWGKNEDSSVIHYHLVIKEKPAIMNTYFVVFLVDENGEYTGKLRLAAEDEIKNSYYVTSEILMTDLEEGNSVNAEIETYNNTNVSTVVNKEKEILKLRGADIVAYKPDDWRAELYLQGLEKVANGIRPDIYEQELLDLFDTIYDFRKKEFKADLVNNPNDLKYFIDYLEPASELFDISVDSLYPKVYSYQKDNIRRLYDNDIPNVILVDVGTETQERKKIIDRCEAEGQPYANINSVLYSNLALGVLGYSAQETARELLYDYTHYNESITLQVRPIYYLDVNTRITINNRESNIYGDYIIKTISLSLDARNFMSISASKAVEKI